MGAHTGRKNLKTNAQVKHDLKQHTESERLGSVQFTNA